MAEIPIKEIARMTGLSPARIYQLRRKLGRNPTVEEVVERKNRFGAHTKLDTERYVIAFMGKRRNFTECLRVLKQKYGENATLKEIYEQNTNE